MTILSPYFYVKIQMSQIIPAETNLCHLKNQISDFYCKKKVNMTFVDAILPVENTKTAIKLCSAELEKILPRLCVL